MLLDSIALGEPPADAVLRVARRHDAPDATYLHVDENTDAVRANWELTVRDGRVVRISLDCFGPWEELAAAYDDLVRVLEARHGEPSSAPPDDDSRRDVDLLEEGLPCDRYWCLRCREWVGPVRASASLCKVWPSSIQLAVAAGLA